MRRDATVSRRDATLLRHNATVLRTFVSVAKFDLRQIAFRVLTADIREDERDVAAFAVIVCPC